MADTPRVITAKVAARYVGLSESTLAKLRLNGNGPVYCKLGRRVVYRPADLEHWLQSRTTRDTSDADARFLKALTAAHPRRRSDMTNLTRAKGADASFAETEESRQRGRPRSSEARLCVKTDSWGEGPAAGMALRGNSLVQPTQNNCAKGARDERQS
jgi:predicted DNA-binding transcriptional regulator AlpA